MVSLDELKKKLTPIFSNNGVTRAVVFGSYAKGTATNASDVDIVIETEPYTRWLWFFGILEMVVDALDMEVDLILKRSIIPNSSIEKEINETGRVIYERK